jgi:hypothetical protein
MKTRVAMVYPIADVGIPSRRGAIIALFGRGGGIRVLERAVLSQRSRHVPVCMIHKGKRPVGTGLFETWCGRKDSNLHGLAPTFAYLYLQPDNLLLNAEIIRQGYGFAYTQFPFR